MLDIDTAIKHCLEVAEQNDVQADKIGRQFIGSAMDKRAIDCRECAADHRQLAEWLTELKELRNSLGTVKLKDMKEAVKLLQELNTENDQLTSQLAYAKGLLKLAVEDLSITVAEVYNGGLVCECCKWKSQIDGCCCPNDGGCDVAYRWRYSDEAKKLLNDEK